MKLCILNAEQNMHGKIFPGRTHLVTGTIGAMLKQAEYAVKAGHEVYWLGNTENGQALGITFFDDWRNGAGRFGPFDITVAFGASCVQGWPTGIYIVDCQVGSPPMNYASLPYVDAVQLHSDFQANLLLRGGWVMAEKLYIVPNGLDPHIFYPPPEPQANLDIIYTSSPDRGLHHLLKSVQILRERGRDVRLHVFYEVEAWCKDVWWMHDYAAIIARELMEGIKQPWVIFHGPRPHTEVAEALRSCTLFTYPCDTLSPAETFCTAIIEAMACGCTTLLSPGDCIPSLYGEVSPLLPKPIDVEQWADAIEQLLVSDERRTWRARQIEFARQYEWDKIAPLWEENYTRLLGGVNDGEVTTGVTA